MYSGERILPQPIFNVTYQQSLVAYEFASSFATGKRVLDVACGEGYGVSLLGKTAKEVVGFDYNQAAVDGAMKRYGNDHTSFVRGDLFALSSVFGEQKFDVICCFQTIEHVKDHDLFITSLRSVLAPGGVMIISTPNKKMFPSFNPYHLHELDAAEITALFGKHFTSFEVFGVQGDEAVLKYRRSKQKIADTILKLDFLQARNWLPRFLLEGVYAFFSFFVIKQFSLWQHYDEVVKVTTAQFHLNKAKIEEALDFVVVARQV